MADEIEVTALSEVGLPVPVTISTADLRSALVRDPSVLVETLRDILKSGGPRPTLPPGAFPLKDRPLVETFPLDAPAVDMLEPRLARKLSKRASKLTKGDLLALGGWGVDTRSPSDFGLTVEDVSSIRDVFSENMAGRQTGDELSICISCCCCTPCCCAAAQLEPIQPVA